MLVVGLGNPGPKYEQHRHNVGFMVIDDLRRRANVPEFREKFSGAFAKGDRFSLLKPMTFMNASGDAVQPCAAFLKASPGEVVVVHDELDLPFGTLRIKQGGGHAGHNGLRSIIARLGADFVRIRFGVGRPPPDFRGDVAAFVLSAFDASERARLGGLVSRAAEMVEAIAEGGVATAMNRLNSGP